jgi:murein DD-endopeptidase MepM/ murein hydrolase activator NlpD
MHIILVSERLATAKSITVKPRHIALGVLLLVLAVLLLSSLFSLVTLRHANELRLPFVQEMLLSLRQEEARKTQQFLRGHLDAMALKLGELQAQLVRLDSLGERLGTLVGIKAQELKIAEQPGRGGLLVEPSKPLSAADLQGQVDALAKQLDSRSDYLGVLESELLGQRVRRELIPTAMPVPVESNGSGFGWRIDPFTGHHSMHEGVDFVAEAGTPIAAAASGIVTVAEYHPAYGNMIEIDHGNALLTRYAHASRLNAKVGAVVKRGQKIAEVGSTGRSTGAHLHFEVRKDGVAVNPDQFLHPGLRATASPLARR